MGNKKNCMKIPNKRCGMHNAKCETSEYIAGLKTKQKCKDYDGKRHKCENMKLDTACFYNVVLKRCLEGNKPCVQIKNQSKCEANLLCEWKRRCGDKVVP